MLRRVTFSLGMQARALFSPTAFGVAGAIFDTRGRVLLARHSYVGGWHLPSGGVGRGEHPETALRRELKEEVGLTGGTVQLIGFYARKAGWVSAPVAFYRVEHAVLNFRPNLEVRAILFADPLAPPEGTGRGASRRLAELSGQVAISPDW